MNKCDKINFLIDYFENIKLWKVEKIICMQINAKYILMNLFHILEIF